MNLIFLISLPRAGSTLLQRVLMTQPSIKSKSEPWIMLPLIYMLKEDGMVTEYNHRWGYMATQDFIQSLPKGNSDYHGLLREFALKLYHSECTNNETYFLDKTPRYYLIIKELAAIFPQAKFIFLTRNPIQVIASIIKTFSNNTLRNMHFYDIDINRGFDMIAEGIRHLGTRAIHIRYEDLVSDTEKVFIDLSKYLDLEFDMHENQVLGDAGLRGRLGDKWGTYEYAAIEDKSIIKWKGTLKEYTRLKYVESIIRKLDENNLATHGYDKLSLLKDLESTTTRITLQSVNDLVHIALSHIIKITYLNLHRKRVRRWTKGVVIG